MFSNHEFKQNIKKRSLELKLKVFHNSNLLSINWPQQFKDFFHVNYQLRNCSIFLFVVVVVQLFFE